MTHTQQAAPAAGRADAAPAVGWVFRPPRWVRRPSWWDNGLASHVLVGVVMAAGALQLLLTDKAYIEDLIVPVALGVVAANARRWWLWIAPTMIGIVVADFRWTQDEVGVVPPELLHSDRLGGFYLLTFTAGLAMSIGLLVRLRRRLREAAQAAQAQEVREAVLDVQGRISAEMHDVVGHSLALVVVASEGARYLAQAPDEEIDLSPQERLAAMSEALDQIHETAARALEETRTLVHSLGRDQALTDVQPSLADIPDLVDNARRAGQRTAVTIADDVTGAAAAALGVPAQTAVYRCVQETLTNAMRHAPDVELHGSLDVRDNQVVWRATNAMSPAADGTISFTEGAGISAMRQRMRAVGGELNVFHDHGDFVVEARVALEGAR